MRDEFGLHLEPLVSVDEGATGAESASTVLLLTLLSHVVGALGLRITFTILARVRRHLESEWVRLHDIDGWAAGVIHHASVGIA